MVLVLVMKAAKRVHYVDLLEVTSEMVLLFQQTIEAHMSDLKYLEQMPFT